MKKLIMIISVFCIANFFTDFLVNTKASEIARQEIPEFTNSSKEKKRIFGYFMLDLYRDEIMNAINDYYKDNKINGFLTPKPPHYDIVSIALIDKLNKKGLDKYSYVLKITLLPTYSNGTIAGEDTLYFAVEPPRQSMKELSKENPLIQLIKYEHRKPSKINK